MLSETNKLNRPSGYYMHRETGRVVELSSDEKLGTPMIDAFIQAGFVKVDESEVKAATAAAVPTNAELKAQLIALGASEDEVKKLRTSAQLQAALALYQAK